MQFPEPEYWTFPNGDVVRLYSFHHIREWEQHRYRNGIEREQFKPSNRETAPVKVYNVSASDSV